MEAKQADRDVAVSSPLGEDVLLFRRMAASEHVGRLSVFNLELLSEDHEIKLEDVLGKSLTVRMELPQDAGIRYFNGLVSQFSYSGSSGRYAAYRAQLRPWLWFLTRTADSRIFQNMKVPDIIDQIFHEHGFTDFEQRLSGTYRVWEYCVQYRETDFNFVSRLMEQEGIYYYFLHEDGKHTLVMSDSVSSHDPVSGYEQVPYFPPDQAGIRERDHVSQWSVYQDVQAGAYTLTDFDFKRPKADLTAKLSDPKKHTHADMEVYDYPGEYVVQGDGDNYSRIRLEELHSQYERVEGGGDVGGLSAGSLFKLSGYPREDQNREYLLLSTAIDLQSDVYESGSGDQGGSHFACSFTALDGQTPYRAPRVTPKPAVQGPQTAIVVGGAGEEIWTDEHGRVKVQFHWDREGKNDENSSCWIRVSHPWAGKNWGAIATPRMGQEVIVDFLEGDPDQPIITGRVYNGEATPPYALPDNKTQTGIKSRSSKEGTADNFNEIRFEDKKGEEEVYVHAEKDMNCVVENNDTLKVGFEKKDPGDQGIEIHNDQTMSVGHDRTKSVGNDETTSIGANRTESVEKDESITIGENRTENVGKDESISIGANRTEDVGKDETISIGENRTETVGKKETVSIGDDREHNVGKDDNLNVGKRLVVKAGDEIVLQTGSAKIVMKKNGDITIDGKNVNIKGSGKINAKASSDIIMKGSKILQN